MRSSAVFSQIQIIDPKPAKSGLFYIRMKSPADKPSASVLVPKRFYNLCDYNNRFMAVIALKTVYEKRKNSSGWYCK